MQSEQLGQWYRTHVGSLLAVIAENVWVMATQRPRSMLSATAFIRGLAGNESAIRPHSENILVDRLFNYARCNRSDQAQKRALESDETAQFVHENQEIFTFLKQHNASDDLLAVENFWKNADGLRARAEQGIPHPTWLTQERAAKIEEVTQTLWNQQYTSQAIVTKLSIGVLFNDIVNEIEKVVRPTSFAPGDRKPILAFAGHHNTMIHALQVLGLYDGQYVELSSALAIDLVQDESNQYFVRFEFKKGRSYPHSQVETPSFCHNQMTDHGCPVNVFLAYIRPYLLTPEAHTQACQVA